jgi:N4-gp56 family major capsid protein
MATQTRALLDTNSSNAYSALITELVASQAQENLRNRLVHAMPGNYTAGRFQKGSNEIRYARYPDLTPLGVSDTLTEAGAPAEYDLTVTTESFVPKQYGKVLKISDLAQLDSPHDLISIASERLARAATESMDTIIRDVVAQGTNVMYGGDAANRAALGGNANSDVLTGLTIKKAVAKLKAANVPTFADGFYRAIIHPSVEFDLLTDTSANGFLEATKYTKSLDLLNGEIGAYSGVRFLVSPNAKVFTGAGASSTDVYSTFLFGPDSYIVGDSQTLQSYFVAPGGDHSDPISQIAVLGFKMRFGAILRGEGTTGEFDGSNTSTGQPRYLRIESTATTL